MAKQEKKKKKVVTKKVTPRKKRKPGEPMAAKDSIHVPTTGGYKIVVNKKSPYATQVKKHGAVLNFGAGRGKKLTKKTDSLSVQNYNKRYARFKK